MKKNLTRLFIALFAAATLVSCGVNGQGVTSSSGVGGGTPTSSSGACTNCTGTDLDLNAINEYFSTNTKWENLNMYGNKVTLIPFTHINGPRAEWDFFGIVNFEYDAMMYFKYQVTYLSCTCRSADVNYWQTAYVELSVPASGEANDIKLRKLSFEKDGTGLYLGGFWGDSGIKELEPEGINNSNIFYEDIRDAFIPYLVGKTKGEISQLSVAEDIDSADFATKMDGVLFQGGSQVTMDNFSGVSVSTNNIIRIVNALMDYHAANNI